MDYEESLQTIEQRYRARKWDRMFVSRAVITSKAFLSLKTAVACQVYLIFLNKCQWLPVPGKPGKRKSDYVLANNGEIQLSYIEVHDKYGISAKRFTGAIDELLRVGLIDIAHSGFGLEKDATLYGISERWRKYGTDEFERAERPKRGIDLGFRKGNTYGRNCRRKKKTTVADARCSTVVDGRCVSRDAPGSTDGAAKTA